MPRPQRELDPDGGPLVDFARELRALRARAGDPKFATMSRRTGRSKTALADAVGGRHLARWETVEDFVRACEGDPRAWRAAWEQARAAAATEPPAAPGPDAAPATPPPVSPPPVSPPPATPPSPTAGERAGEQAGERAGREDRDDPAETTPAAGERGDPAPPPDESGTGPVTAAPEPAAPVVPAPRRGGRRAVVLGTLLGLVLGFLVGAGTWAAVAGPAVDPLSAPASLKAITVQNKVAIGPESLVEDSTPAYLSSEPLAYCATPSRNCKVAGTEMASGAALVANCQVEGQRMVNFNRKEAASVNNPYRADSSLWYRASFPDGRSGYLSEVYIVDDNRGGMDLPPCGPPAAAMPGG